MKLLLTATALALISTTAMAQGSDLFPELDGRFAVPQPTVTTQAETQNADTNALANDPAFAPTNLTTDKEVEESTGSQKDGNLKIYYDNMKGTLAYARNYSYCSADVILENNTNFPLEKLRIVLTYRNYPSSVTFTNVPKKGTQKQYLMIVGPECEDILTQPQVEVPECQLGELKKETCEKRVQFIPPNE